ncbi:MAG: transposase, partial [Desulfobacteraceae bacterium]|nr:transposase [Desulfobacteraceae bacterium]
KKLNGSETIFEFECYAGNENTKVKIRFFAVRVPEKTANEKRRRMYQNAKKKGRTPTKKSLKLCDWNFLMTNIPTEKGISVRSILAFYPVRRSAELFFRQLKSVLNIHRTEVKKNEHRLRCEVTGKAIAAMFISYCYSGAGRNAWKVYGEEISFDKTVKYFKRNIAGLTAFIITVSAEKTAVYVRKMIIKIIGTCRKKRQKTRKNSLDVLIGEKIYEHCEYKKINLKKLMSSEKSVPASVKNINVINLNINIKIKGLCI